MQHGAWPTTHVLHLQASRQQLEGLWETLKAGDRDGSGKLQAQQFTTALLAAVPGLEQAQVRQPRACAWPWASCTRCSWQASPEEQH